MRKINYIVVHCSGTREDCPYEVDDLRRDHLRRGFKDIGYHYYIRRDGTVARTRPIELPGAHVKGFNKYSIGICYEGGLDRQGRAKDTRTPIQRAALRLLVSQLLCRFHQARVCGHRDLSPDLDGSGTVEPREWVKRCPCFEVSKEL
ncbi:N-acetylmuramoyl-L-alanine amidase [Bacteroides zoogleoformans]|uniref:N-acetylmuramoyl-L-alanine amidase n=1 Tax=Bacteroides zoogleoformans TaxID=28119 RepID=A0ABM6T678_9BACE|nr:N-acetylmuramoyl-L-alanine amidase [Bacteroides zoogleoformans]AVM52242.1 N-acetylmuramoyl-L-alanine amidase [Bacteroides zoogleoformans]TWJ11101.1 N-acetylmuramoyl-L-alanine amidase [Bacteroides zoogleoformans]